MTLVNAGMALEKTAPRGREPNLRFSVRGVPGPQGSKDFKGFSRAGKAILVESSKLVKPWRQDVIVSALDAIEDLGHWQVISGPVHVVVEFFLPRPKGQPKTRRTVPTTTPDLDKLVRATGDALKTAGVYRDDSLVTDITTRKRYVVQDPALGHPWELPGAGAVISIFAMTEEESWADRPLDLSVSERFPVPVLPEALIEHAGYAPTFERGSEFGELIVIPAVATDGQAMQTVRKVLARIEKRVAMPEEKRLTQPPVTVVVEGGLTRLASVPGRPSFPLQDTIASVAEAGVQLNVSVLLADVVS